jgi:hypothetical protein
MLFFAKISAVAFPIPEVAPVINAVCFMFFSLYSLGDRSKETPTGVLFYNSSPDKILSFSGMSSL